MAGIMLCQNCKAYTLKAQCSACSSRTVIPKPARYSPDDHYGTYRRRAKESRLRERGWL